MTNKQLIKLHRSMIKGHLDDIAQLQATIDRKQGAIKTRLKAIAELEATS